MSTLYVNNIEPVSGSELTLISASLISVDNLTVDSLTSSFQGDLQGTASFATTASYALNSTPPGGIEGQIQFNSGSTFGADSNLYWDNTNKRLGIGTSTPNKPFEVLGDALINAEDEADATLTIGNPTRRWDIKSVHSGAYYQLRYYTGYIAQSIGYTGNTSIGAGAAATARLHVKGGGSTSATTALLVENSSGTELLKTGDSGITRITNGVSGQYLEVNSGNYLRTNLYAQYHDSTNVQFRSALTSFVIGGNTTIASALVNIESTTKGFLPPRMTTTEKNAISSPASGLQVYDNTAHRASLYASSSWENIITETSGSPNSISNIWSGTQVQYDALTPDSTTLYFIV